MPAIRRPAPRAALRPEIQGLRALAVLLVVVHHRWPTALAGGYVGVDVFFAVSGFLITGHLLREAAHGGLRPLPFWAARTRRILPAALTVVVVVTVGAALLLPPVTAAEVGRAGVAGALSTANVWFGLTAVDYQAVEPAASPLLHLWSLGVEEQTYLVWPLIVLVAVVVVRRARVRLRTAAITAFAGVVLLSFVAGLLLTASADPGAYYATAGRAWELAAGGMLAAVLGERTAGPRLAVALQVGGLGLIVAGAALLGPATPVPGVALLMPVTGALAVIAAGDAAVLRPLTRARPVRWLGDASFSVYLWHWPVFAFSAALLGAAATEPGPAVLSVAVALGLAALSARFVEAPFRRIRIDRPGRVVLAGATATVVVAAIAAAPVVVDARQQAREEALRPQVLAAGDLGHAAFPATWADAPRVVVPDPREAAGDVGLPHCTAPPRAGARARCTTGDRASGRVVALLGDSHAFQWLPGLDAAGRRHGFRVESWLQNSCPFSLHPRALERSGGSTCRAGTSAALAAVLRSRPDAIVVSGWRGAYPGETASAVRGYRAVLARLERAGLRVVVLGDTPAPDISPTEAECVSRGAAAACGVTRAVALDEPDPLRSAARGLPFIDPTAAFCTGRWCPAVIGSMLVHRDDNHVSASYMRTLGPWIDAVVVPALGAFR